MKHILIMSLLLSGLSIQEYYDFLRVSRNPFMSSTRSDTTIKAEIMSENQNPQPIPTEILTSLDQLKSIVTTNRGQSLLYIGSEIFNVEDQLFGLSVVSIQIDRVVLKNHDYTITKVLGKPVEVTPNQMQQEIDESDEKNQ